MTHDIIPTLATILLPIRVYAQPHCNAFLPLFFLHNVYHSSNTNQVIYASAFYILASSTCKYVLQMSCLQIAPLHTNIKCPLFLPANSGSFLMFFTTPA